MPLTSLVIAIRLPARRLKSELLPTFGLPTKIIFYKFFAYIVYKFKPFCTTIKADFLKKRS